MKNTLISISIIVGVMFFGFLFRDKVVQGGGDGYVARSCVASSSEIFVGKDLSTKVLATSSNRAWARISIANNATNTLSIMLNDVTAVSNQGILLNHVSTGGATSTSFFDFGLNTDMPYTGAIKVITNFGTTTALVTQCNYNR